MHGGDIIQGCVGRAHGAAHTPRIDPKEFPPMVGLLRRSLLLTAVLLEYPFSGSIAVTTKPFDSGTLAQLARLHT